MPLYHDIKSKVPTRKSLMQRCKWQRPQYGYKFGMATLELLYGKEEKESNSDAKDQVVAAMKFTEPSPSHSHQS